MAFKKHKPSKATKKAIYHEPVKTFELADLHKKEGILYITHDHDKEFDHVATQLWFIEKKTPHWYLLAETKPDKP